MNEIEVVRQEVLPIPAQAKMIVVKDQVSLGKANDFFLVIRALKKKIAEVFDPMEEAAKEAKRKADDSRKTIVAQREKIEAPLKEGEAYLSSQIIDYKREQDRIRAEEQEILRQKAIKEEMERRKAEEEARMTQAAALEAVGAKEEAEALVAETIEEIEKPIEVYVPPPATPRIDLTGASIKTYWSAEITDLKALCRAVAEGKAPVGCVEPNMTVLNAQARALKKEMNIPGVRPVSTSSMASTGKSAAA